MAAAEAAPPAAPTIGVQVVDSTIGTLVQGLSRDELTQAVRDAFVGGATVRVEEISRQLGVAVEAAKTLLKIVGQDPNIPDDKLPEALAQVAGDHKRLQAQVAALKSEE